MTLARGERLGPGEILVSTGKGGMREVFRARYAGRPRGRDQGFFQEALRRRAELQTWMADYAAGVTSISSATLVRSEMRSPNSRSVWEMARNCLQDIPL